MQKYIVFYNNLTQNEYACISLEGLTSEEVIETVKLLAYENSINTKYISWRIEER